MTFGYLLIAAILFSCILADRFSGKFGGSRDDAVTGGIRNGLRSSDAA